MKIKLFAYGLALAVSTITLFPHQMHILATEHVDPEVMEAEDVNTLGDVEDYSYELEHSDETEVIEGNENFEVEIPGQDTDLDDSIDPQSIIGVDNRVKESSPRSFPALATVYLSITWENGMNTWMTGAMIGKDLVMTVGHAVYSYYGYGWAKKITVSAGMINSNPLYVSEGRTVMTPREWKDNKSAVDDIALIRLNSDLGSKTGWYEVVKDVAVGQSFVTRGYPEDLLRKENKINLWKTTGKVTQLSDKRIYMDADVIGGQSGSPILTDNKLFGVVAYSMSNVNSATRINNRELNWIQGYANDAVPVYRLYNQTTGEHLYTSNMVEVNSLTTLYATPWKFEKAAWCGTTTGKPVYRVYNPNNEDHHYTVSASERDSLVRLGWKFENIAWNAPNTSSKPVYRLYNPNATIGSHHYTMDPNERDSLVRLGWTYEGIAWYSA